MKLARKVIIAVVVVAVLLWVRAGYQKLKGGKFTWEVGKTISIKRGDMVIPVTANGSVEPSRRLDVKSKASGKVLHVHYEAGQMVRKGTLLVELDPVDEERNVKNAKAELTRAQANLGKVKLNKQKALADWANSLRLGLANLDGRLAMLQNTIVTFDQKDLMRRKKRPDKATLKFISPDEVVPVKLEPVEHPQVKQCARQIGLAEAYCEQAKQLIDYGRKILDSKNDASDWSESAVGRLEYQGTFFTLKQVRADVLAACADLRSKTSNHLLVKQVDKDEILAKEAVTQRQVAVDQAEERLADTKVYAPFDALVEVVDVNEGDVIQSGITTVTGGTPLIKLADVSKLYVVADVDEADIGRVRNLAPKERSGSLEALLEIESSQPSNKPLPEKVAEDVKLLKSSGTVRITVDASRDEVFEGLVDLVDPHPNQASSVVTYRVHILLTSANRTKLFLGMNASVEFTTQILTDVLLVDNEAIRIINDERGVYVPPEPGKDAPVFVPLKLGETDGEYTEILSDKLKQGDQVYTELPSQREEDKDEQDEEDE